LRSWISSRWRVHYPEKSPALLSIAAAATHPAAAGGGCRCPRMGWTGSAPAPNDFPVQPVRIMPSSPSTYMDALDVTLHFPRQGHYVLTATAPLVVCADAR
jgi:hypothetical protein